MDYFGSVWLISTTIYESRNVWKVISSSLGPLYAFLTKG